jgi:hypothetical protein
MAVLFVGCGKSNDNSNNTPTYSYIGGTCYNTQNTNVPVSPTLCSNLGNNGYTYRNNGCYNSAGQQVQMNFCSGSGYGNNTCGNSGYGGNGYGGSGYGGSGYGGSGYGGNGQYQVCSGTYLYQNQQVTCNGQNCSGYTLISLQTCQQVYCQ